MSMNEVANMGRRAFVSGAAAAAAGIAATSTRTAFADAAPASDSEAPFEGVPYEVYSTDLLIIGSGLGGTAAAFQAIEKGYDVLMVDKGPYISSGPSGMNYDMDASWYETPLGFGRVEWPTTTADHNILLSMAKEDQMVLHMDKWWMNHGETFSFRKEDGTHNFTGVIPDIAHFNEHANFRLVKCDLEANPHVNIHDHTMITDFVVVDGVCLGAVGYHVPTGSYRVYRAKATISCGGGCGWNYGWITVGPYSPNMPENTADLEMAAWRKGAQVGETEWTDYSVMTAVPTSVACGYMGGVGSDSGNIDYMVNSEGEHFFNERGYYGSELGSNRTLFARIVAEQVLEGKGSPLGGVYTDYTTPESLQYSREMFTRNISMFKEVFGIDLSEAPVEQVLEQEERAGAPVVDTKLMSIDFQGLFFHRGAGIMGEATPTGTNKNASFGSYAARCAVEYIESQPGLPEFDWAQAEAELDRLDSIRRGGIENGIRPVAIRRAIQKVGGDCLGVIRTTAALEAGIAELERIRKEDLPRQSVVDSSLSYNMEWREAVENYNLLDLTEMSARASLMREETRGGYYRPEFPEIDNENWQCMLACRNENGEFVFEKRDAPQIDWTTVDWDEAAQVDWDDLQPELVVFTPNV